MDHSSDSTRHRNAPMAAPYVYNGFIDQTRGGGSGPTNAPPPSAAGARPGVLSGGAFGTRPMSMLSPSAAANLGQPYMDAGSGIDHYHYHHTMNAPHTAAADHSFHTIMISDGAHPASRIAVPGAAAAQAHAGIPARQRRGPTDGDAADAYDGLLSSSLPSGSPTMHGGFPGVHDRAGPDFPAPYAPVTYPPLSAAISRGDSGAGLSPGHPPHPPHARTASHQAAPRQLDDGSGQLQWPSVDSVLPYSSLANQAATIGNTLRSSASDISLPGEQQQPQQQAPGPVYQMLAMDTGASGSSGAAQLYPVSQPGLPPAGPASASLSAYAMGVGSPMVARGRGRRKPYNAGDYPDADSAMNFSPDTPPALTAGPVSASALLSLPAMRQTLSNNDAAVLGYGPDSERWSSASRRPSGLRVSTAQHQGFGGPVYSPAASVHTADQMPPATATEPGSARAGVYSYPEMAYAADTAAQPGWDQPDTMMDTSGGSDCDVADGSMPASLRSTSDGRRNAGSQASLRPEATPEGSPQYHEQAAIPASMAHMRWNPATGNSPLRMEIGGGGLAHIYGTLPRTQAAAGALHGQPPPAAADTQAMEQRPWPRISPQNNGGQTATTQQCSRSGGPDPQPSPAAAAATDYYMITSPGGPVGGEPAALRPGSSTLLPMVEVGQGARVPLASNMDEINAHSQEYLHRRRRRLTQTMHNRQRSGSAADTATRHSTSRLNAGMPMSSPGAMSHGSNRSMEDAVPYSSHLQPLPAGAYQAPAAAAPVAPYVGGPYVPLGTDYVFAEQAAMGQTRAQEQAQAEYMRRLRLEHERLRLAIEQQQQQQQAKLALAQEQEVARFRNYRPLMNLTVDIVETYRRCRPEFYYESTRRPRRVLTHPSEGVKNDGFDNENSDYILYVNDVIGDREGHQFLIMEMLGSGTFGQVVKCQNLKTGELSAVKVIKNKTAYYNQSMMEVQMLDLLNKKYDVHDRHHILRLREWFVFRNHLVLVNELLSINLYDLLKQNQYQGLSTNLVRVLVQQILDAMIVLKQAQVIHADLKPENILLEGMEKPVVKVIDFGSACFEWQTTFVYIQSRFYRSPEILLGLPYSSRIDMWSLGCIVAELYLGLPLFPGSSEYNQLSRIVDLLGIPPRSMLDRARRTDEFFNYLGPDTWDLKGMAQYASEHNTEEKPSKRFFQATTLEELIKTCPIRRRMSETEQHREFQSRLALIDFLRGLLQLDPDRRWSPHQAAAHPFITGEPFLGPFVPASDTGASSGSRGPYGTAPGSGHYHSGGGGGSGGGSSTSGGGGGGGGSGHPHTIGYSSRYGAAPGASGYAAHMMYGGGGGSGGGSGASSVFGPSAPYSGAVDAATWAYRGSGAGGAVSGADGLLSIPGAFPVIDSSGTQSRRSSQHVEQPPLLLPPPPMRTVSKGRSRATTLGHQVGAVLTQGGLPEHVPLDSGHGHSYAQHSQAEGFLGLDPSTSHTSDSPPTDGEPRDVPGRLDASLSSSEYSVGAGWASWSETNYSSNGQSSNIGGHETQAGSTQGPKGAPEPLALRSYLLSERQRQRLAQQRLLHQSDLASGNGARTRLVSNMSPLTLPSTPGSSVYSSRYMGGSAHERLLGSVPEAAHRVADLPEHYANSNSGSRSGSEAGSSNLSAAASGDLGFPRPLTQAAESASSLGLYFDGSGRESDASSLDGSSSDEADYEQLSDEDADDSSSEHSDGSDGDTCGLPLPPALAIRASCELWSCPAPEHDADSASFSSLRFAVGQSLPDSRSSIYTLPRYAAYSQDVLSSGALAHRAAVEQESFSGEEDGHVYIDVASVISQEMSGFASPLENPEAEAVAGRMGDLHTDFGTNADSSGRSSADPSDCSSSSSSSSASSAGSDNAGGGGRASQDTVLFTGKLRPAGGEISLQSLSPSPIPQPIRLAPAATFPQRVMKWSQQLRTERMPQVASDSQRMVEALQRMGKWHNWGVARPADQTARANQFFFDPVILAMSPRLMPQPAPPG